jgi:hypothetical protein
MYFETKLKIAVFGLAGILLLVIASAIYAWLKKPAFLTTTEYVRVPEIKEVVKVKRVNVPGPKEIVTIEKPVIVEKLKLPEDIAQDQNKQITATGEIPPYEGKTNVVAVMDTQAGTSEIIAKQQPLPFIAFKNEKEFGIRAGLDTIEGKRGDLYGRWTFFRIGSVHLALYGEGNTRPEGKAMLDISYRWK